MSYNVHQEAKNEASQRSFSQERMLRNKVLREGAIESRYQF
jgi:hypothetical protein